MTAPLPNPLRGSLVAPSDDATLSRIWAGVRARRTAPAWRWHLALIGAAVVAVALAWIATRDERPGGSAWHADRTPLRVDLAAGIRAELAPGAAAAATTAEGELAVHVSRGRTTFTSGSQHRWHVDAPGLRIQATRAVFAVSCSTSEVAIEVITGDLVVVPDGGAARPLAAGTRTRFPIAAPTEIAAAVPPPVVPPPVVAPPVVAPPVVAPPVVAPESVVAPAPARHATAGTGAAPAAAPAPSPPPAPDEVAGLLSAADAARRAGRPADAVAPLRRILAEHPDHPDAAVAAYMLGHVLLRDIAQPREAARAYQRAIELGLPASLSELAHVRLVEAYARAGLADAAAEAAARHRSRFPDSTYGKEVSRWSGGR